MMSIAQFQPDFAGPGLSNWMAFTLFDDMLVRRFITEHTERARPL